MDYNNIKSMFARIAGVFFFTWLAAIAIADNSLANTNMASNIDSCAEQQSFEIKGKVLRLEIANTTKERRYGLMFRRHMSADCGMLFVFDSDQQRTFTMRNTLIPLDIAFIKQDGSIAEIFTMQPGVSRYPSSVLARYALEMNAGWFTQHGINLEDKLQMKTEGGLSPLPTNDN